MRVWESGGEKFQDKCDVALNPDYMPPHFDLAIIYSLLGREEEVRAEAAEVLRINPSFSLEAWRHMVPLKDPVEIERSLAAARKAGLK